MLKLDDLFEQRKQLLNEVIEFNNNENNRTCALVGEWGSGKSFFIEKLIKCEINRDEKTCELEKVVDLKQNNRVNFRIIKFDAWENQGNGNVNAIFLETIYDKLLKRKYDNKPFFDYIKEYFKDWLKDAAIEIIKSIVPSFVGKSAEDIANGYEEFQELLVYETFGNQMLNQIIDERKFYDIVIEKLLIKEERYLFIIDELDRCEPHYAMELIKKVVYLNKQLIKENYDVNFLISINKNEFANLLKGYYGSNYDTHQYFDKIFDYEFDLPNALSAYEYLGMLLAEPKEGKIMANEFNRFFSLKLNDKFENLNYRKLQILAEKIQCDRDKHYAREQYKNKFCVEYYYDRVRFCLEVLKLSRYNEYCELKANIIRLKKTDCQIDIYDKEIVFSKHIVDKEQYFLDVRMTSKYFTKENSEEINVIAVKHDRFILSTEEINQLAQALSCEMLCLIRDYPL